MRLRALAVTCGWAVASAVVVPASANSIANRIPAPVNAVADGAPVSGNSIANRPSTASAYDLDPLPPAPLPPAPCSTSIGPAVAGCVAIGGLTPEIRALNRLACLLEGIERFKLATLACAQRRVDEWQATVMWPRSVLESLRTTALARVRTLREQYEERIEDWSMPTATQSLASIYGSPRIVTRSEYETVWGHSRGPAGDIGDVASWLSVTNRNTLQGRTSAAFGIAGELPENSWERIGREGAKVLRESQHDPLRALRHTPQMLADRARVETNTLRLQAQTLATRQVRRDFTLYKKRREQALGRLFLDRLIGPHAVETGAGARS